MPGPAGAAASWKMRLLFFAAALVGAVASMPYLADPALAIQRDNYVQLAGHWRRLGHTLATFPDSNFGPVYTVFVSLFPEGAWGVRWLVVAQIAISSCSALLARAISLELFKSRPAANLATLVWLLWPTRMVCQGQILTETLYVLLLYAGIRLCLVHSSRERQGRLAGIALSGFMLGIAALTRGNGIVVFAGLFALLFFIGARRLAGPAVLLAGFLPLVLAWSWHNHEKYGYFKPTPAGSYNVAVTIVGPAKRASQGLPDVGNADVWKMPGETFSNTFRQAEAVEARALAYAKDHVAQVFASNITGWARAVANGAMLEWERIGAARGWGVLGGVLRVALLLLACWLLFVRRPAKALWSVGNARLMATGLFVVMFGAHVLPAGGSGHWRLSFPLDMLTVILGCGAICALWRHYREPARSSTSSR